ncbi:Cutinase-like protein 6 [Elsinoe fawcettii]|nr:Cutinase-like protein 6 [Elsinoe fawcettii]
MKSPTTTLLATAALSTLAQAQANVPITCVSGLHLIVARASNEAPGFGILGPVKDQILSRVPQSDAVWVPYPATITNPPYTESQPQGVGNISALIRAYGDACPTSRMALLGYSQGAHIIGDALIGGDYAAFPAFVNGTGVGQKYLDQIAAVIMMGDPANVDGQSFLVGNSTRNGFFPRNNTERWEETGVGYKLQSYCDAEDTFCDSGTLGNRSLLIHIGYIPEYGNAAADYVVARAPRTSSGGNGTNATSTSSPTGATSTRAPVVSQTGNAAVKVAQAAGPAVLGAIGVAFAAML